MPDAWREAIESCLWHYGACCRQQAEAQCVDAGQALAGCFASDFSLDTRPVARSILAPIQGFHAGFQTEEL